MKGKAHALNAQLDSLAILKMLKGSLHVRRVFILLKENQLARPAPLVSSAPIPQA